MLPDRVSNPEPLTTSQVPYRFPFWRLITCMCLCGYHMGMVFALIFLNAFQEVGGKENTNAIKISSQGDWLHRTK